MAQKDDMINVQTLIVVLCVRSEGDDRVVMILCDNKKLQGVGGGLSSPVKISFSGSAGLMCGEWLSFGAPDLPGDQRLSQQFQVQNKNQIVFNN